VENLQRMSAVYVGKSYVISILTQNLQYVIIARKEGSQSNLSVKAGEIIYIIRNTVNLIK